ncbi:hypothetical protein ACFLXI_03380 [Chloroflexota bacterium]
MESGKKSNINHIPNIVGKILQFPFLELIYPIWEILTNIQYKYTAKGMYEVQELETTLEILDSKGKKATVKKRQKVRYLQDHIIAYQDQAWGDGEILVDYQCSPGMPVDQYRFGHKTIVLISLRSEKNKGDLDEFYIHWKMKNGFVKNVEAWSTVIQHKTKSVEVKIIFPKLRPPHRIVLIENNHRKAQVFGKDQKIQLPDGRWQIRFERLKPRLNREYMLEWEW